MSDLTTRLVIQLKHDAFTRGLRDSGRGVEQFGRQSRRELRSLKQEFKQLTGGVLGQFKHELLAIGTGWAGLQIAKDSALLDQQLTRITQTAGAARTETEKLRNEFIALQRQYGTLVDHSMVGTNVLVQGGLSLDEALGGTDAIARANAVTDASPDVLAKALGASSGLYGFDLTQPERALELLDKMTVAGRLGHAELEDLAGIFSRIGTNAKMAGMGFDQTLGFVEQLSKEGRAPEQLATLADSTLRIFTNTKYQQKVKKGLGVDFYDKEGSKRAAADVLEDISTIYKKFKTDQERDALIGFVFGEMDLDTQKGIKELLAGDAIAQMREKTRLISQAQGTLNKDIKDALDNAVTSTQRLKGALREAADAFIQPLNEGVTWTVKKLLDSKEDGGLGLDGQDLAMGGLGALAAGGLAYRVGGPMVKKLLGKAGGLGAGVATGKALEAAAGVVPVYVVNMPSGGFGAGSGLDDMFDGLRRSGRFRLPGVPGVPGLPGAGPLALPGPAGAAAGGASLLSASSLGAVALAGGAGYGAGTLLYNYGLEGTDLADGIGRGIANVLAFFGNDNAQATLATEARVKALQAPSDEWLSGESPNQALYQKLLGDNGNAGAVGHAFAKELRARAAAGKPVDAQSMRAALKIEVDDKRTRVRSLNSDNMDVDVSGRSMEGL